MNKIILKLDIQREEKKNEKIYKKNDTNIRNK